jgi:hypothetical protein
VDEDEEEDEEEEWWDEDLDGLIKKQLGVS